jgi:pimeloyl-ACP methyl ester carboxylesterase
MFAQNRGMAEQTMVPAGGVDLCVQTFGDPPAPPVLLIAGAASAMDWWDEEFCRRLAAGGRRVIRYDHRDTGRSTSFPPGAPPYRRDDLATDALALLDSLDESRAHLVAFGLGGLLARHLAAVQPARVWSLTLIAPADVTAWPRAEWGDRRAAVDRLVAEVQKRAGPFQPDEPRLRRLAQQVFDRSIDMMSSQVNHRIVFAAAPPPDGPIGAPTLVLRGNLDRFAEPAGPASPRADGPASRHANRAANPRGNRPASRHANRPASGHANGPATITLDGVGHEYPPRAVWPQVIGEILRHTGRAGP